MKKRMIEKRTKGEREGTRMNEEVANQKRMREKAPGDQVQENDRKLWK